MHPLNIAPLQGRSPCVAGAMDIHNYKLHPRLTGEINVDNTLTNILMQLCGDGGSHCGNDNYLNQDH